MENQEPNSDQQSPSDDEQNSSKSHPENDPLRTEYAPQPSRVSELSDIGRFKVLKILGEGGMGRVLLARDTESGRLVAIKEMKPDLIKERRFHQDFIKEARRMQSMNHPNILPVLELDESREQGPYYVMPYVDGGSLVSRFSKGQPMAVRELLPIAEQIADALQYAHDKHGLIHRDLKPENVLLDQQGTAYLCDFGLVRSMYNETMV